jgi:hypothetical protein
MGIEHFVALLLGLAGLVVTWLVWTGRWKAAGTDVWQPNWAWTTQPVVSLMCLGFALAPTLGDAVWYPVVLALVVAVVFFFWEPDWFGPRWWRERDKGHVDMSYGPNVVAAGLLKPDLGERGSLAAAERTMAPARPYAKLRAALVDDRYGRPSRAQRPGIVEGYVLLYERGLVFAARPSEDRFRDAPTILRMQAASLRRVQRLGHGVDADGQTRMRDIKTRVMPRVRIDGGEGSWILETRHAGRLVAELERRYGIGDRAMAVPSG